jgi:hypothetical protein
MRNELIEGIILGIGIGVAVMGIRMLVSGASLQGQVVVLLLVGAAFCLVQLVLIVRRAPRGDQSPRDEAETRAPAARRRSRRHNPFAHELTRNWTGLDERVPPGGAARPPDTKEDPTEGRKDPPDEAR